MPYIKYPELSYQIQILLEKLLKMSDTEFNLLKKRISRAWVLRKNKPAVAG